MGIRVRITRKYLRKTGDHMHQNAITLLAQRADLDALTEAWGVARSTALGKQKGERPLTLHEAWMLARMNGVRLSSLLDDA